MLRREQSGREQRFWGQFGHQAGSIVSRFVNSLQADTSEVVMFTARKAACFGDCLRLAQLWTPHSIVCSDKALDFDTQWLEAKNITIVDDLVGTGRTVDRLLGRLKPLKDASSLSFIPMATRPEWPNALEAVSQRHPGLQIKKPPVLSAATDSLREDIIHAIAAVPRPYNLDWPLLTGWELPEGIVDAFIVQSGWTARETTSPLQIGLGVRVLTLEPAHHQLPALVSSINAPASTIGLAKVRLYLEPLSNGNYRIAVMPIIAFDRLAVDDIPRLLDSNGLDESFRQGSSNQGLGRIAQYYCSLMLGRKFTQSISHIDEVGKLAESRWQLSLGFSPALADRTFDFDHDENAFKSHRERRVQLMSEAARSVDEVEEAQKEERFAGFTLYSFLYGHSKQGARRVARDEAKLTETASMAVFLESDHEQPAFSVSDLVDVLVQSGVRASPAALVSAFLDEAIDNGLTVPIITESDGYLDRVYRAGETIEFSMREQRLFSVMISETLARCPQINIGKILLEKMLVLAVRFGAERKPLLKPINVPSELSSLTVAYSRYGSILTVDPEALTLPIAAATSHTLGAELAELGVIKWSNPRNRKGQEQRTRWRADIGDANLDPTHESDEAQFERLGGLIGDILTTKIVTPPEFELFVILCNGEQIPLALGVEVGRVNQAFKDFAVALETLPRSLSVLQRQLAGDREWFLCLSSALVKLEGISTDVVARVDEKLTNRLDRGARIDWREVAATVISPVANEETEDLKSAMQDWLVRAALIAAELRRRFRGKIRKSDQLGRFDLTSIADGLGMKFDAPAYESDLASSDNQLLAVKVQALTAVGDYLVEEMTVNHDAVVVGQKPIRFDQALLLVSKHPVSARVRDATTSEILSKLRPSHIPRTHTLPLSMVGENVIGFAVQGGVVRDLSAHAMPYISNWLQQNAGSVVVIPKLGTSRRLLRATYNMYWHGAGFRALCRALPEKCEGMDWPQIVFARGGD